jgi:hypothetical protein
MKIICFFVNIFVLSTIFQVSYPATESQDLNKSSQKFKKITILTQPLGAMKSKSYGGHYAVTRSLVEGLKKIEANFNYNPSEIEDIGDIVHVLCNEKALAQAIEWKKKGLIKKLSAGPNLLIRGFDCNNIICNLEVDLYLHPSSWPMISLIQDEPSLKERSQVWYSGVDTNFWCPAKSQDKNNNVLVYWKTECEKFCKEVEESLLKFNWKPIRIKYGSYKRSEYKKLLDTVSFAVFISRSESQGLAMVESWAMDVPTLIWEPKKPLYQHGKIFWPICSCPYLNKQVGKQWTTIQEFEELLQEIKSLLSHFTPREWVLKHMSDEVSARVFLKVIDSDPGDFINIIEN